MTINKILFIQALALIFLGISTISLHFKIQDLDKRITKCEARIYSLENK